MSILSSSKITFCPGPGALIPEWTNSQKEFFGRGDFEYTKIKKDTFKWLKKISKKDEIIPIAGSGTTAALLAFNTFLQGKILVIDTGYYSQRWIDYLKKKKFKNIHTVKYDDIQNIHSTYDWIIFVYVETATCTKFDIKKISKIKKKLKSKLLVDATASIALEKNHQLADVIFFSSCKGLLGPTGLGFVACNKNIKKIQSKDFWYDYNTHSNSKYTLGYNCISALHAISKKHNYYKNKIIFANNVLKKYSVQKSKPLIGCKLLKKLRKKNFNKTIFYQPRVFVEFDVIFFLGIVKLDKKDIIKVLKKRIIDNLNKKIV